MERATNLFERLPLNEAASKIGSTLTQSQNIENSKEIKTLYGTLTRIGKIPEQSNIPPEYRRKKCLFYGQILDQPVVVLHFSSEVYGQDKDYFQRIYQNSKDVFSGKATQFADKKITPSLLGYDDKNMTLIIEKAPYNLEFYFSSTNEIKIRQVIKSFIGMINYVWEKSKKTNDQVPRYVATFLKPEYPFLKGKKPEDYLKNPRVIFFYKQTQEKLKKFINKLNMSNLERGFGFGDVSPSNLVEDKNGNILFIDVGKPSFSYHWLSMLGQFYQTTTERAPNSLFSKVVKQEIKHVLENSLQPELAIKSFALGRINNYLLGCTLRNIVFNAEAGLSIDENRIGDVLAKVRHLTKTKSIKEVIKYADDEFDSEWRERLKDYHKTLGFKENLEFLKKEINKTLPKEKPEKKLVFVFTGIPGSGKSTVAQIIQESIHPGIILRSDWVFFEKLKDQIEDDYYKAYAYQEELARQYLQKGYSVIMDDNNRTIKNRAGVYKWVRQFGAEPILIKIDVDLGKAADRVTLKGREIKTKEEIIEGLKIFNSQMEKPSLKEKVKVIGINGNKPIKEIKLQLTSKIKKL